MCSEPSPALAVMPKENIGYGSAFGYFYGYLHLVLPGIYSVLMKYLYSYFSSFKIILCSYGLSTLW